MYLYVERIRDFFWVMRYTNLLFTYLLTWNLHVLDFDGKIKFLPEVGICK